MKTAILVFLIIFFNGLNAFALADINLTVSCDSFAPIVDGVMKNWPDQLTDWTCDKDKNDEFFVSPTQEVSLEFLNGYIYRLTNLRIYVNTCSHYDWQELQNANYYNKWIFVNQNSYFFGSMVSIDDQKGPVIDEDFLSDSGCQIIIQ